MRRLLLHEKKILEIMLLRKPASGYAVPESVVRVSLDTESCSARDVLINQSFTNYFRADTTSANLELFDCHLCVPDTVGNELFLVKDIDAGELAFMEFMHTPVNDESTLLPYMRVIHDQLRKTELKRRFKSLASEFRLLFDEQGVTRQHKEPELKHVRLLVFDPIACFFLSTSDSLLVEPHDASEIQTLSRGAMQLLSWRNEIGVDGWISRV